MLTIKIMNDFLHSPIWTYDVDGLITHDPGLIAEDAILQELCQQIEDMYLSYYEFDTEDGCACRFDHEKEKTGKDQMLRLLEALITRLNEINDGSFVIEDYETEYYKNL